MNYFDESIDKFIKEYWKNSLNELESNETQLGTLKKYNYEINWEEILNALLSYKWDIMQILYFETSNWKNKINRTSKNIKLKWAWRFAIYNFIKTAKENWQESIKFDIMKSEIWFYEKIEKELENSKYILNCELLEKNNKNLFIINL